MGLYADFYFFLKSYKATCLMLQCPEGCCWCFIGVPVPSLTPEWSSCLENVGVSGAVGVGL